MKTWVLLVAAALVSSCTCRPQIPPAGEEASRTASAAEEAAPQTEAAEEASPQPEEAAASQPQEVPPAVVAPPSGQPASGAAAAEAAPQEAPPEASEESFVVTEEVYNRTFEEVEQFIQNLNEIIRKRDYQSWLTYLSDEYVRRTSAQEYLQEQSESPLLKKNNIRLGSLRDYFENVVVPSRSQATVEDIEFIDENHVKVFSSIRGRRGILYLLVRENGNWKIGVWE